MGRRDDMMANHHAWVSKVLPGYTGFWEQLKDDERPYNKLEQFITRVEH